MEELKDIFQLLTGKGSKMANYTLFINDDKQQVSGGDITLTSTVIDGGSAAGLGIAAPTESVLTDQLQLGGRAASHGSQIVQQKDVFGAFQAASATADGVADASSPYVGSCDFADTSHSLSVGDVISITGSTTGNVDGVHVVVFLPDVNSFVTNRPFTVSATAGDYSLVAGRFASMTAETWIIQGSSMVPAARAGTFPTYGKAGITNSIHQMLHMRTARVASAIRLGFWDIFSGSFTTAPVLADDMAAMNVGADLDGAPANDSAANPTYGIPGELVYRTSGQQDGGPTGTGNDNGITLDDYEAKTG